MSTRNYEIETSDLIVLQGTDGDSYKNVWAIFDVSPTVECRFIAVHWQRPHPNETFHEFEIITVFGSIEELLTWSAHKQVVYGAEFRAGLQSEYDGHEFLEYLCQGRGYEDWNSYVAEQGFSKEPTEGKS